MRCSRKGAIASLTNTDRLECSMRFIRNNWYRMGLVAFAAAAVAVIAFAPEMDTTQRILLLSLMALPLHQYEEYALPGGGPAVINRYFYGEAENYRRYPGNWNSIMVVNLSAYVFYILALAFPQLTWLGMATMFFNLYQVLGHCLQMNIKMGTWYNPGMATSAFLFLPISVCYIAVVTGDGRMSSTDWALAVICFALIAAASVALPVQLLKRTDSPYPIPQWQVDRLEQVRSWASIGDHKGE